MTFRRLRTGLSGFDAFKNCIIVFLVVVVVNSGGGVMSAEENWNGTLLPCLRYRQLDEEKQSKLNDSESEFIVFLYSNIGLGFHHLYCRSKQID